MIKINFKRMKSEKDKMTVDYHALYRQMVALRNWHWWFRSHYSSIQDTLRPYLKKGARLLDMGCGPGVGTARYPAGVGRILMDIRPLALSYCPKNVLARICSDADYIALRDETCDIVICSDLLHQRDVKDPRQVVKEAYRVCRSGGVILLVEPAFECLFGPHDEIENGIRRFTASGLLRLFDGLSVRTVRRTYFHLLMFFPAFLVRRVFSRFSSQKDTDLAFGNPVTNRLCLWLENLERLFNRYLSLPLGTSAAVLVQCEKKRS